MIIEATFNTSKSPRIFERAQCAATAWLQYAYKVDAHFNLPYITMEERVKFRQMLIASEK